MWRVVGLNNFVRLTVFSPTCCRAPTGGQVGGGMVELGGGAHLGPPSDEILHLHDFARDQVLVM